MAKDMSEKEIYDEFKDMGITNRRTQRALLALVDPDKAPNRIVERWQKLGVLNDEGRVILCKGESLDSRFQWILFAMIWDGHIERVRI